MIFLLTIIISLLVYHFTKNRFNKNIRILLVLIIPVLFILYAIFSQIITPPYSAHRGLFEEITGQKLPEEAEVISVKDNDDFNFHGDYSMSATIRIPKPFFEQLLDDMKNNSEFKKQEDIPSRITSDILYSFFYKPRIDIYENIIFLDDLKTIIIRKVDH